ncbi:C40 family peptidase [Brevibacillus composti]|uniref:C40 family peptidase n=1 Tax=Brevibacillus composti TaxID=2796470 RepID=A0A7T5EII2_9BACL|nr:NlpC/P60 family protein [Brevibacillus composti]QQE73182.1 C40 family peptidase [Brevibacillus composti]QUO40261.1 C40 family peptidase [Brevibacillus composti]
MTKRDWIQKSTIAVMLGTSLLMFADGGQAAAAASDSQSSGKAAQVVSLAQSLVGKSYQYGAEGPTRFGSAGLATYVYEKADVTIGDTISKLYASGKAVSKTAAKPGDLLFFSSNGSGAPNFMGIYLGDDSFVYSSQSERKVVLRKLSDYTSKLVGVRSFLSDESGAAPKPGEPTANPADDADLSKGERVIAAGKKYLGTPYQYASTRSTKTTMDCSEFTMWAYKEGLGIDMGRGGAKSQANYVKQNGHYTTDMKQLKKGDLVFFMSYRGWKASDYKGVDPSKQSITHVGIYMGDDKLLHTFSKESGGVKITNFSDTHWEYRFIMGGRPY